MTIFEVHLFWVTLAPSYYGLMYILWFLYGIWAIKQTGKYSSSERDNLFLYIFLWVLLGGRLGYVLFYSFSQSLSNPLSIFRVWEWWMSFHGWMLGVIFALYLFARNNKKNFLEIADDIALIIPVGLFFGRIWNYINKELLGFPYEGPLAVITHNGSFFPSPLVEAVLEWIVIFVILKFFIKKAAFSGQLAALFLILYGVFRTFVELFIRTPDAHIGYYFWFLSQWAILSIVMIVFWIGVYFSLKQKSKLK